MKKSLLVIVALVVCLPLILCFGCSTEDNQITSSDGMWKYIENEDGTITLTSICDMQENVVIPEQIDGKTISALGEKLFVIINDGSSSKQLDGVYDDNNVLKTVTINAEIKEIPNMCFYLCRSLENIILPETLEKVSDFAFYGCNTLTSITLPEKCSSLGAYTFRECGKLREVVIESGSVPKIGDKCFYMVNTKASGDDQYFIISDLQIKVKDVSLYSIDNLEKERKATRDSSYKYWQEYVSANVVK